MFRNKLARYSLISSIGVGAAFFVGCALGAHLYTRRDHEPVRILDELDGMPIQNINILAEDGEKLSAWYIKNDSDPQKVVIIVSGRACNRNYNIQKARIYLKRGYSVLLPDLRATGNSTGDRISFGWEEQKDLVAWYYFLQTKGFEQIGAHGHSIGAATICYSLSNDLNYDFIVLESCYLNLIEVVRNGLWSSYIPPVAARLMIPMSHAMVNFVTEEMHPGDYLKRSKAPLLIMGGADEILVPASDTIELFSMNQARFSKMHLFEGAKHDNFSYVCRKEFAALMHEFLDKVEKIENDEKESNKQPKKRFFLDYS